MERKSARVVEAAVEAAEEGATQRGGQVVQQATQARAAPDEVEVEHARRVRERVRQRVLAVQARARALAALEDEAPHCRRLWPLRLRFLRSSIHAIRATDMQCSLLIVYTVHIVLHVRIKLIAQYIIR